MSVFEVVLVVYVVGMFASAGLLLLLDLFDPRYDSPEDFILILLFWPVIALMMLMEAIE